MFYSYVRKFAASKLFPARNFRGAPWALGKEATESKYFVKDVEIKTGLGPGVLYCFSRIGRLADPNQVFVNSRSGSDVSA